LQRTTVSVGPSLRKVRESRGVTLDEAARDTRVRREFLEAIEAEDFHLLLGDVHVRGCLRTYATYLRLSPDKVIAMYEADLGGQDEVIVVPPVRSEPVLGARRRRDDHRLWILVAATMLVLAAAFGVLSARRPAPPPANLSGATGTAVVGGVQIARPISVAVEAQRPVEVTIVADAGDPESFLLRAGEGRSFDASNSITVRLSEGNTAHVIVSGVDYGFPGKTGEPWEDTFSYDEPSTPGG